MPQSPSPRPVLGEKIALSEEHAATVRATLPLVGAKIHDIAPCFYGKMFTAHPELLRNLFNRGNQAGGMQPVALAASVAAFATILVDPSSPDPDAMLRRIVAKHVSLGIREDQYQIVHDNLFAAIVEILGDAVTPPVAEAWDEVYWLMARTLINAESSTYTELNVAPGDVFRTAVIAQRHDISDDVVAFDLVGEPARELPTFAPGQYTSVGVHLPDGARQLRQYSLCSAPTDTAWRIYVKRVHDGGRPDGEVSNFLHKNFQVGDLLEVTLPVGAIDVPADEYNPVVLISAGIGCTPMLGLLRAFADGSLAHRPVYVAHVSKAGVGNALQDELAQAAAQLPQCETRFWVTGDAQQGREGTIAGRMTFDDVPRPKQADFYVCGPEGFSEDVHSTLVGHGIDESRIHIELFTPNMHLLPA
ncbi:globin domain-containing protein [Devriesea agamarum]|uniref:globin domain-containing protein n=1 Tax=Devriesea agamarum TaxID=472569 RepID=UPI00071C5EFA|nr:globin domain-containing protein [Devriesea agamarum]